MTTYPRFVITFSPAPHINAIRSLRWLLKIAKRRFGLIAVDAYEDCFSPLEISNLAADEFKALRNEIIEDAVGEVDERGLVADERHRRA